MIRLFIVAVISFLVFTLIHFLGKNKKPFKRAFWSVVCGPLCLVVVNILSSITDVLIPVTELSLMTTVAGGIPGVALMVIMSVLT